MHLRNSQSWRALLPFLFCLFLAGGRLQGFVFDTFGDGFWKIVNRANGNSLLVTPVGASQSGGTATDFEKQFQVLYNLDTDTFRLRNRDAWLCIEAQNAAITAGAAVVEGSPYTALPHQRWKLADVGGGDYRIVNVASNLALQTDGATPANVTLAAISTDTKQYWRFEYQTHYPKKGSAGYENDWGRYKASWNYSWGKFTNPSLPSHVVFEPMQHNRWWDGTPENLAADSAGFRKSAKPVYMLGFNEPDHTDQANVSVAEAIALWPYFQDAKLPLVSPVVANGGEGWWLGDFYNQINSKGYRVDFTAAHWYAAPNADNLINYLQSLHNTHGRPIWLTEFANIDWSNTQSWSEEDCYRFLAEFMWRAEDLIWLKRYSVFSMAGAPPTNPWDSPGDNSNMFSDHDGGTFTAFGELYASWDGDRTIRTRQPYLIHNKAASHRMTSTGAATPGTAWLRESGATAQWALMPTATTGRYYIQSLHNSRRLRYNGTTLDLALPGTTGTDLEWSLNASGDGYFFIDHPARARTLRMNRTNNGNGAPTALGLALDPAGSPSDNTRFRFIKPYVPVRVTGLEARYDFEGNVLDTSGEGNHGAVLNGVTYVAGKVGAQAAQFDGAASFVRIPSTVEKDITIACWIKTTQTGPTGTQWWSGNGIVDGEVAGATEDYGLSLLGGKAAFGVGNPDTTVISTTVVNDGAWHHIAATRSRAGAIVLYVDGVSQGTANGPAWDRFGSPLLRVGGRLSGGNYFAGAVDDLRVYNYVLPGSNITGLINTVPAPWTSADLGSPNVEGYTAYAAGSATWTVGGCGSDFWNTADQGRIHTVSLSGNSSVSARLSFATTNTDGTTTNYSKGGVMFRESTATGSPFVGLFYTPNVGLQLIRRDTANAVAAQTGANLAATAPCWLKLTRVGTTFTAYRATTAGVPAEADWQAVGTVTNSMTTSALAGLAVSSHDNGLLARAAFTNVSAAIANTAPTLSNIGPQAIAENGATSDIPVIIGDAETAAASLTLTATSSNTALVPNANLTLGGSGAVRSVKVTPAPNQSGSSIITLTVSDGILTASDTFTVTVQPAPGASWRQQFFGTTTVTAQSADTADPDNDGLNNLIERALGGNPLAREASPLAQPSVATGPLTLAFVRNTGNTDLTLTVQAADSPLGPWLDLARSTLGAPFDILATGATVTETGTGTTRTILVGDIYHSNAPAHPTRVIRVLVVP